MRYWLTLVLFAFACGVAPVAILWGTGTEFTWSAAALSGFNLIGWSVVCAALIIRRHLLRALGENAKALGLQPTRGSVIDLYQQIVREQSRKSSALSIDLIENRISTTEELSRALEKIVGRSFKLLAAESAELVLFDKESGGYHSSFVLGRPVTINTSELNPGALLNDALTRQHPGLLMQPISFAGTVLGSLCVELKQGRIPSLGDKELLKVLALQGTLAIVNSRYNEELLRMRRSSEESVKAKTGFLANLSHELRAPLGIILNAVEIVIEGLCGPVSADQADTLKMVRQNGQHLLELINDVLDYAKTESGTVAPNRVQIVVDDLLADVTNVVRAQAQQKNHTLVCRPADAPLAILSDRRHIRQMLINLLTNAIKYTPPGGRIEVWADRAPGNRIKIHVKDSGIGIEASQRHKVFTPFERVESAYSVKQLGTGLGMPLTRRLAELNGGACDFDSTVGTGSEFWLLFPATEYSVEAAESAPTTAKPLAGSGRRLLIIDRDSEERPILTKYLEHIGYTITQAGDTKEALELARQDQFGLILLGNDLADDSGDRLVQDLRAQPLAAGTPIVLLSSRAFEFDIEKYLRQGIDRCLAKPVELKEIASAIDEMLRSRSQQQPTTQSEAVAGDTVVATVAKEPKDLLH